MCDKIVTIVVWKHGFESIIWHFGWVQRRHIWTNIRLVLVPLLLCLFLLGIQLLLDVVVNKAADLTKCGSQDDFSIGDCPIPNPPLLPPLLQIPEPESRAVSGGFFSYNDLPDKSCRKTGTCPVTILLTGNNHSLGQGICASLIHLLSIFCYVTYQLSVSTTALSGNMFGGSFAVNSSDLLSSLAYNVLVRFDISFNQASANIYLSVLDF